MSKSYVSMEQNQCPTCFKVFDTGAILLDKRLRESMEQSTVTGQSLCPECQKKLDDGYIALIEADEATHQPIGRVLWLRADAWPSIFNVPVPPKGVCMVPPDVVDMLLREQQRAEGAQGAD